MLTQPAQAEQAHPRSWGRIIAWSLLGLVLILPLLDGVLGWYISTNDHSPIARALTTREKRQAVDALRAEGTRVSFLLMRHAGRNGWWVSPYDRPSSDDAYLQRIAPHLRTLQPAVLRLNRTNVGDSGVAHLSGITSIVLLDLGWTDVGDPSLEAIATLSALRELYINHTNVTDAGLANLLELHELKVLSVGYSCVTEQGIDAFTQLAPHVHVDTSAR